MNTLARRLVWFGALVTAASVLVTGLALYGFYRSSDRNGAAASLGRDLDFAAAALAQNPAAAQSDALRRMRLLMSQRGITMVVIRQGAAAPAPVTAADLQQIRSTGRLSTQRALSGQDVLIQGKLAGSGTVVVLRQPATDAIAALRPSRGRLLIPLVLGLLGGGLAGLLLARGISRPLAQVSRAARRLSAGERGVTVPVEGPLEVADVAQALNGLSDALAASEEQQRKFLVSISHELRTPLTAVSGYAEALANGVMQGPDVPAAGRVIRDEAMRLQLRVEDLLALARMEADDFRVELAETDVAALVRKAAQAWEPRAKAAGVKLGTEVPPEPLQVRTDAERVRQAVDALVDNALRVLPDGAPLVIGCRAETNGWVRVEVRDGGPGLEQEDLAVAFERGRLTERYRGDRPVGSGLGLALVGELARRLGGHAEARQAPEGGAGFALLLPPR